MNKVQPAQHDGIRATVERPATPSLNRNQRFRLFSLSLLAGTMALLTAWTIPSHASGAIQDEEPQERSSSLSDADVTPINQPTAQRETVAPAQSPVQPQSPTPRRSVILTPTLPNRTIVPPPTSVFPFEESYTLGPSDQIQLDIFDIPELSGATSGRYIVQLDGTINLIWAGVVNVQGLTLRQAEQAITQAYSRFVRDPLITVSLIETRSLRVSIAGEVKRPGAYVISPEGATDNRILVEAAGTGGGVTNQWPTVTKAIQAAGGITQFADLRRVQVRRPLTDGSLEVIDVNLWELLRSGELNQDIRLRDRDTLVIPTATTLNESEALTLGAANFSPETIRVNVIGEVPDPGVIEVAPNTPMNQALLSAGGFLRPRARTSKVELVRLNPNGTAVRRTLDVDLAAGINEATNPALRDYDTIIVSRNGRAVVGDNVEGVVTPVNNFLSVFSSFFGIFDIFGIFDN